MLVAEVELVVDLGDVRPPPQLAHRIAKLIAPAVPSPVKSGARPPSARGAEPLQGFWPRTAPRRPKPRRNHPYLHVSRPSEAPTAVLHLCCKIASYDQHRSRRLKIVVSPVRVRVSPSSESAARQRFLDIAVIRLTSAHAPALRGFVAISWPKHTCLWRDVGPARERDISGCQRRLESASCVATEDSGADLAAVRFPPWPPAASACRSMRS
jgi:hypothetical protein